MTDPELDRQVAEQVMGCHVCPTQADFDCDCGRTHICEQKRYTTDSAAWMQVVEKMREKGNYFSLSHSVHWQWVATFADRNFKIKARGQDEGLGRAICLAALQSTKEKGDG